MSQKEKISWRSRRESQSRAMMGPIQVVFDFKDYFLILWELKIQITRKNWRTRKHNQERKVKQRKKKKRIPGVLHAQGGSTSIVKVEFQNLESYLWNLKQLGWAPPWPYFGIHAYFFMKSSFFAPFYLCIQINKEYVKSNKINMTSIR